MCIKQAKKASENVFLQKYSETDDLWNMTFLSWTLQDYN